MSYEDISLEIDGGIARLTFRRPDKLNALREQTGDEMQAAFDEMEQNPDVRVVLLTGEGRAFGAGYDLTRVKPGEIPDMAKILEDNYNPLTRKMRASRLPIVSVVNGPCAGASVGIALSADIVIAARSAYFYEPFVGLALIPDAGNTLFLPRIVGRIRAAGAMLLAEKISAEEALSWGMVWRVYEDAELMGEAEKIVQKLAGYSPTSVSLIKKLISEASDHGMSHQLDMERDAQGEACGSEEMQAAIASFFKGKP
ncbi:MAG: 2-(1,2-epoxy-1,2-dihydrophenyl)acetyl-CoA isomerase [Sneathiella sp.]|jgi:2-(1,2-epoxy-1,2-dihydrophenyl)acetyl-CoA isomerase|uniref:enoyl-CoA hydratase-related protein n=1 Tax=Sneathiella sp. TaxID=1964365 RepID=UPI000C4695B9|nr:enoyl-CoA hydratase-related protein [Sneathiella sp.]MAL77791.1 2-(1,2-epoxy-1,2-dihydrophenyl)acetyl-CoA isomerase [Sneathiella sp.]|tara:strand:- start:818 stop:1582 length:765 start_codon:yes stop_codon:yes gene_type:complete